MSKRKTNVEKLREIRDKMNEEVKDMDVDEYLEYLKSQSTLHTKKWWAEKEKTIKAV
ncbi:hypothetical protein [Leptospira santarosai]|uniref:hypothetical protein n=1 Tax=Leptospira santarosai TaxID=28183 RepID=UPI0002B9D2E7|nr:hypothetical protein [Leptospira santarosai]EMF91713.1 hypothetical protein LEP1GSC005_2189 [Leptospira santarosai str. ST188]EMO71479.1 hypothetical protein LEP1GSC130_0150 [Leptospira santarosai str. 200403458]